MDVSGLNSAYTEYLTSQKNASATKLEEQLKSDYSSATDEELMDVCKSFESYFVEQRFKGMMKTVPESEDSDSSNSTLVDYFTDTTLQELCEQSTEQNSLGLAQMMYEQMKRNYDL